MIIVPGKESILVKGSDKLAFSVTACLLLGGYSVTLFTEVKQNAVDRLKIHKEDLQSTFSDNLNLNNLTIVDQLDSGSDYSLAIVQTSENSAEKRSAVMELEQKLGNDIVIAINTESIDISDLQAGAINPNRIIGANWVEPAHATSFLEIIYSGDINKAYADKFCDLSRTRLRKDPYLVANSGIRARLMGALFREAGHLIQHGYATIEDIDRACRNDAGYYLPFAGNFRYMDLMGTSAYGTVMKNLNPELAKDSSVPDCLKEVFEKGGLGMQNSEGFYNYKVGDAENWDTTFRKFSYEIQDIMSKYPFGHDTGNLAEDKID
ncbi:MAG: 3-hydroxyacyl-CoA dehydrogenase family protein [Daejeonella sp.]